MPPTSVVPLGDASGDAVNRLDDAGGGHRPSRVNCAEDKQGDVGRMENDGSPEFRGFVAGFDGIGAHDDGGDVNPPSR